MGKPKSTKSKCASNRSSKKASKDDKKRQRKSAKKKTTTKGKKSEKIALSPAEAKKNMLDKMAAAGFDGSHFADMLEISTADKTKKGKPPRKNRFFHYCSWAHALVRNEVGPEDSEYSFPPEVLSFIRALVPGDIKGEIREEAFKVDMDSFCMAMEIEAVA